MIEIVLLLAALGVLIFELKSEFHSWLSSLITLIRASSNFSSTKDEIFRERYDNIMIELNELCEGRYSLSNISEVYDDDIRSIRLLQKGDTLRSMCPVQGTAKDAEKQLSNKNFIASMEAHYRAADRKANIHRIYIFESSATFKSDLVQNHLMNSAFLPSSSTKERLLSVSIILLDDDRFHDARELPHDFIIFGDRKVSVGRIAQDSRVAGGDVFVDRQSVAKYRMEYDRLLRISEDYEKFELQKS
ncbi:DUF6879 family protein [Lentilitoribacter sp. Alg239-R112]|uniref:DUF6879 family protein n=1 Tax=Lentilitoribacter sp. Alg239-R112 TaxID=2305987 RepID=UPI0013A70045|nr:DUF6879 family protein [Lentilitoribacter sp. Alg239-R112]